MTRTGASAANGGRLTSTERLCILEERLCAIFERQRQLLALDEMLRGRGAQLLRLLEDVEPVMRRRWCDALSFHDLIARVGQMETSLSAVDVPVPSPMPLLSPLPPLVDDLELEGISRLIRSREIRLRLEQLRDADPLTVCQTQLRPKSFHDLIPVLHSVLREFSQDLMTAASGTAVPLRIPDAVISAVGLLLEGCAAFSEIFRSPSRVRRNAALLSDLRVLQSRLNLQQRGGGWVCLEEIADVSEPPPRKRSKVEDAAHTTDDVGAGAAADPRVAASPLLAQLEGAINRIEALTPALEPSRSSPNG